MKLLLKPDFLKNTVLYHPGEHIKNHNLYTYNLLSAKFKYSLYQYVIMWVLGIRVKMFHFFHVLQLFYNNVLDHVTV